MSNTATIAKHHGKVAKLFHWATAGLLGYGYLTGVNHVSELADPQRFTVEIIFAVVLGLAFLGRYLWMWRINGHTRLTSNAPRWEHLLSSLAHHGIYAGVGVIVLSGLAISYAYVTPALDGLFLSMVIELHEFSLGATAVLLGAHVVGAVWHKVVRKDGIWESMLPKWRRAN